MSDTTQCARPACNCIRGEGKKYCSEVCADASDVTELTCQCGHVACRDHALEV
jgi:hypothetical protein